jgi:signal peptidase II
VTTSCPPDDEQFDAGSTAVAALLVDVVTKAIAVGVLVPGDRVPLIGDHVWCALTRNAGAAFS